MTDAVAAAPAPPTDAATVKACCAGLWAHPVVRLLAGDTFRPGGLELSDRLLDALALPAGATVLDVGSGAGATLELVARRGLRPVGVDYSAALASEARVLAPVAMGDAERLPVREASCDAALAECVLSAVPDKPAALGELHRVVRPGGKLGVTDVTLDGELGAPLDSLVGWIACAAGATTTTASRAMVESAGFVVESVTDHAADLRTLVEQARRRLALLEGALGSGVVPPATADGLTADLARVVPGIDELEPAALAELGRHAIGLTLTAIDDGRLGYVATSARRA